MANFGFKDSAAASKLRKAYGDGSSGSPFIAGVALQDDGGGLLGVTGSPLVVSATTGSVVVTNTVSASISAGSVALLAGANIIGSASAIQSTAACPNAAWPVRLSDLTDTAAINSSSQLLVSVENSPSVVVASGSVVVTNALSASISGGSVALLAGANIIGSASVIQGTAAAITAPWAVKLSDSTDSVAVTAGSALRATLYDTSGCELGTGIASPLWNKLTDGTDSAAINSSSQLLVSVENSPSVIVSSGSVVVTNALSASVSGGSVALLAGANVIGSASVIQGTAAAITAPWTVKLSDGTDSVAVTAGSGLHTTLRDGSGNILGVTGSPLVITGGAGGTSATDQAVYAEGSTAFTPGGGFFSTNPVSLTACQSGAFLMTAQRAVHVNLRDGSGNVLGVSGSPLVTSTSAVVTNTVSASISAGSVALLAGANVIGSASSIQGTAAAITAPWPVKLSDSTDSVAVNSSSQLTVSVDNALSASISGGSVALLAGANIIGSASVIQSTGLGVGAAWSVRITDTTDSVAVTGGSSLRATLYDTSGCELGTGIASPLWAKLSDGTDSAAINSSSQLTVSVDNALSASISGGSVALLAGANVIGSASVIQGTAAAITAPWAVKISDSVDSVSVNTASQLLTAASIVNSLTLTGSMPGGTAASPQYVIQANGEVLVSGSILSITDFTFSASSGSQVVVSGSGSKKIRLLALTFTTSTSMNISWRSGSTGGADLIEPMYFATHGGMTPFSMPYGYIRQWSSGCAVVINLSTSGCVRGFGHYAAVPD